MHKYVPTYADNRQRGREGGGELCMYVRVCEIVYVLFWLQGGEVDQSTAPPATTPKSGAAVVVPAVVKAHKQTFENKIKSLSQELQKQKSIEQMLEERKQKKQG